jgi:hypothetical protein
MILYKHRVHVRFDLKPIRFNQMKIKFGMWTYFVRCRFFLAAGMIHSSGGYGIYRSSFQQEKCSEAKVCSLATRQYILYAKSISDLRSYYQIDSLQSDFNVSLAATVKAYTQYISIMLNSYTTLKKP